MPEIILDYEGCRDALGERIAENAPGRVQMLCGPRQVGKTTLLLELADKIGEAAQYAAADGPEASAPGFWERLWAEVERKSARHRRAVLFIDEIHLLPDWGSRLKGEWDRLRRKRIPVQVVVSGSSSLRLGRGSRAFKLPPKKAAELVVEEGSYPGAFGLRKDRSRWKAYIDNSIVEPAIGRDIMAMAEVRRPALLRQVFALSASFPAQIVSLQKLQGQLRNAGALETIASYLSLLEQAFLVVGLEKFSQRPDRRRSAPPKLVLLNNALLAATDPRSLPAPDTDADRYGNWVENACLAHALNQEQHVTYWREEPYEVDAVIEGSWGNWVLEIKTGRFSSSDLNGLFEFTRRHRKFRPLVVCDRKDTSGARRYGVEAVSWHDFLNYGPSSL
jgi:predicted AAA+ superfamily ATPase